MRRGMVVGRGSFVWKHKGKGSEKKGLWKEGGSFTRGSASCSAIILALCTLGQLFYVTAFGQLFYVTALGQLYYVTAFGQLFYVTALGQLFYVFAPLALFYVIAASVPGQQATQWYWSFVDTALALTSMGHLTLFMLVSSLLVDDTWVQSFWSSCTCLLVH